MSDWQGKKCYTSIYSRCCWESHEAKTINQDSHSWNHLMKLKCWFWTTWSFAKQLVQTQRGVVLHTTNKVYQKTQIVVTHKESMCTHNSVGVSRRIFDGHTPLWLVCVQTRSMSSQLCLMHSSTVSSFCWQAWFNTCVIWQHSSSPSIVDSD